MQKADVQRASSCFVGGYRVDQNIKGQGIYAYAVMAEGTKLSAELQKKVNDVVETVGLLLSQSMQTIYWAPSELTVMQ